MDAINQALEAKDYEKAVELATNELKIAPQSARLLLKRSIAYLRLQKPEAALADAEAAVGFSTDSTTSGDAQLRRAVALYQLKRFGEARTALQYAKKLNCTDKALSMWQAKVDAETTQNAPLDEVPTKLTAKKMADPAASTPIRKDWYQIGNNVTVSVFIRDAPANTQVQITADRIVIPDFGFELDLSHAIDPSSAKIEIGRSKIELTFAKAAPGNWAQLAKTPDEPKLYEKPKASFEKTWDIEDDEDESENADPQSFFEKIYKDADPDARRAMMKSFVESNGTTLSTNWDEVKKGKVQTAPPKGMEAKDWQ